MASLKLLLLRRLSRASRHYSLFPSSYSSSSSSLLSLSARKFPHLLPSSNLLEASISKLPSSTPSNSFSSSPPNLEEGPTAIDYGSLVTEDEFHRLADSTIEELQERFEEYGECVQIDGFDIDYGNQVLTLKLGELGTYVMNKQTPNRQIWLSSPVSGPSRFDWDRNSQAWIYRRTKANLLDLLEKELEQLCGEPVSLS